MIKLRPTVAYKKENDMTGFLFSVGDDSNQLIKVSGLINQIAQMLSEGQDYNSVKAQILNEYDVTEEQFQVDIEGFKKKLQELNFI